MPRAVLCCLFAVGLVPLLRGTEPPAKPDPPKQVELYSQDNLVAWCIVPFDGKKRTSKQRVEMLQELGFKKFAYDWRAEDLKSFDEEVKLLKEAKIELTAVWFPANLGEDAQTILDVIKKHEVKPQLWVTIPDPNAKEEDAKVADAVKIIKPIAEEAAKLGCSVGLYNHGGWFGEPEHLVAIIEALKLKNVGIVYNLHHGHDHFERFAEVLKKMVPPQGEKHLLAINLNGSVTGGDKAGKKIMPLGTGDWDVKLLSMIRDIGYTGPVGIIGHTEHDAAERLADNLDGLKWLLPQLEGKPAGEKPTYRTYMHMPKEEPKKEEPKKELQL